MNEDIYVPPGLYRILLQNPTDVAEGSEDLTIKDAAIYATVPVDGGDQSEDKNLGIITLETPYDKGERQVWRVEIVEEQKDDRIYAITRADGDWLSSENPPSLGYDGTPELQKHVSCMGFKKPEPGETKPPNPYRWRIFYAPPSHKGNLVPQPTYIISPVPPPNHELQCFIDHPTKPREALGGGVGVDSAGEPQKPEPAMILNKVRLGVDERVWYFESWFKG